GLPVTINGSGFDSTSVATFTGGATATPEAGSTATAMKLHVPNGATTGPGTVHNPTGADAVSTTSFTGLPPPTITGFTPTSAAAGTQVTIAGTNLTGVKTVSFAGATAPVSVSFSTSGGLKATVPTTAISGPVTVATTGGSASSQFTVLPKITSFSP